MSIGSHLMEAPEDLAVKERLWDATRREVMRFAQRHAAEHVVGEARSEPQADILEAAKRKGYEITLIENCGTLHRRIAAAQEREDAERASKLTMQLRERLRAYAHKIGLGKAFSFPSLPKLKPKVEGAAK